VCQPVTATDFTAILVPTEGISSLEEGIRLEYLVQYIKDFSYEDDVLLGLVLIRHFTVNNATQVRKRGHVNPFEALGDCLLGPTNIPHIGIFGPQQEVVGTPECSLFGN